MSSSARSTGDGSDKAIDMATDNTQEDEPAPATADENDSDSNGSNRDPTELPFLVTHWLSTLYNPQGGKKNAADTAAADTNMEQKEAMDKIRRATADLASAFSSLGAFGTASRVSIVVVWINSVSPDDGIVMRIATIVSCAPAALVQFMWFVSHPVFVACILSSIALPNSISISYYHSRNWASNTSMIMNTCPNNSLSRK
jgi:hypothetical protein